MGTYESGNKTKYKISEAARELFYKNGFSNTTYKQLGNLANVNLGMIVYHFKSLDNLAEIIYADILKERSKLLVERTDELFGKQLFKASTLLLAFMRINTQAYLDYPNFSRFIVERLSKGLTVNSPPFDTTLHTICEDYRVELSDKESMLQKYLFIPFTAIAANGIHLTSLKTMTAKDICDYAVKMRLKDCGISDDDIDSVLKDIDFISDKIRLSIDDHMHFSIK